MAKSYSGVFVIRIPPKLHQKLAAEALEKAVSLNQFCLEILSQPREEKRFQREKEDVVNLYRDQGLVAVILFGSVARGDFTETSDVDFLLVFEPDTIIQRSMYRNWDDRYPETKVAIHCVRLPPLNEEPSSIWLEVALEGRVLFRKDERVRNYLNTVKSLVAKGQFDRRTTHGQGYWLRNTETIK